MKKEPREFRIMIGNYGEKGWSGPSIPWGSTLNLVERGVLQEAFEAEFDDLYKKMVDRSKLDEALKLIDLAEVRLSSGLDYMKQGKRQFAPNTTNSDVDVWIDDVSKALAKIKAFKESIGE